MYQQILYVSKIPLKEAGIINKCLILQSKTFSTTSKLIIKQSQDNHYLDRS
jgi:hypothetical protein